jgi:O-antigen ligase
LTFIIIQHYLGADIIPYRYTTFQWESGQRVYPLYGQFSSLFIMIMLPILLLSRNISKNERMIFGLTLIPIFITLYLSASRTSIISITLVSFAMLLFKGKKAASVTLLLILVAAGTFYAKKSDGNLIASVTDLTDIDNPRYHSNKVRINMIRDTFDIFESHPVTGIGYNGYSYYSAALNRKHDKIFNDTLNVLATMGILGMIPFLWLIFFLLRKNYTSIKLLKIKSPSDDFYIYLSFGIFLAYLSFLVNGLFEPIFFNSKALMLMLILLSINSVIISEIWIDTKASV